ncbi:MAG: DUF4038 domain-containing protein, partial [Candidatus Solibacter sp.]|nr:DUF4038 domain-containing protein [Candidatus Solibacter sp.]
DYGTRRNHYCSILNAPIVGITYGASGVWSWSDGASPVPGHGSGVPPAWKTMLDMPAAGQMTHLIGFFQSVEYWRLKPVPGVLAKQPGEETASRFISAAQTPEKDLTVIYTPTDRTIVVRPAALPGRIASEWFNPRTGGRTPTSGRTAAESVEFSAPADGDWLLVLKGEK